MSTSKSAGMPGRKAVALYGEGCAAGKDAATAAFERRRTPGGTWQHALIDQLQITDLKLKGWVVGYCAELQALSLRNAK